MPKPGVANADNIVTIPKAFLHEYLTTLSSAKLAGLERSIKFSLELT